MDDQHKEQTGILEHDIQTLGETVVKIRDNHLAHLQNDITSLREEMQLYREVSSVKTEVATIKTNVAWLMKFFWGAMTPVLAALIYIIFKIS